MEFLSKRYNQIENFPTDFFSPGTVAVKFVVERKKESQREHLLIIPSLWEL